MKLEGSRMSSEMHQVHVIQLKSPIFAIEDIDTDLIHGIMGVETEAGELADVLKKKIFYDRPIDKWAILEEVGDTLFYLNLICACYATTFEEVMAMNMKKLHTRYPGKFTQEAERKRDYAAEKEAANFDG